MLCSHTHTHETSGCRGVFHWQFLPTYIFSVFRKFGLKFGVCYITGQWSHFRVKNATLYLQILFWHFCWFSLQNCVLIIFIFDAQQNINQSETEICNRILSVELYGRHNNLPVCPMKDPRSWSDMSTKTTD